MTFQDLIPIINSLPPEEIEKLSEWLRKDKLEEEEEDYDEIIRYHMETTIL